MHRDVGRQSASFRSSAPERSAERELPFLLTLAGAWALCFAAWSVFLHLTYRSTALDLALHSQLLWNLAHGRFMETSFLSSSFLGYHFWPALYLLVPVYALGGTCGLLVVQSGVVALGVLPAYYLAFDILKDRRWARLFAWVYLLQPTLSAGLLFDFHTEILTVPCMLTALLALRRGNRPLFWSMVGLSVSLYEVVAAVYGVLGLSLLSQARFRKTGWLLIAGAAVYALVVYAWLMPHYRAGGGPVPHWERYAHLGPDLPHALAQVCLHPINSVISSTTPLKLRGFVQLLGSVAFLSLLAPRYLLPALPLFLSLFFSSYAAQTDIRFGYLAPLIPFLMLSAIQGARGVLDGSVRIPAWMRRHASAMLLCLSTLVFLYVQLVNPIRPHPFRFRPNLASIRAASALVPPAASLSGDNHLAAHFPNRRTLLVMPETVHNSFPVDFVFLDLAEWSSKSDDYWHKVEALLKGDEYGPVYQSHGIVLLKRGVRNDGLAEIALQEIELGRIRNTAAKDVRPPKKQGGEGR